MIKQFQKIKIPWTQTAQNYYEKLGYSLRKGQEIEVDPLELPSGSHRRIQVICDKCGLEVGMEYRQYVNKSKKFDGKYYCKHCAGWIDVVRNYPKNRI